MGENLKVIPLTAQGGQCRVHFDPMMGQQSHGRQDRQIENGHGRVIFPRQEFSRFWRTHGQDMTGSRKRTVQ